MPVKLKSVGGGEITLDAPNTASNYTVTLPASNTTILNSDSTLDATKLSGAVPTSSLTNAGLLTLMTSKYYNWNSSNTNTFIDFTDIPSWVKRITITFDATNVNSTSPLIVQLGDSGGFENTGYTGYSFVNTTVRSALSSGFMIIPSISSADFIYGQLTLVNSNTTNGWIGTGLCSNIGSTALYVASVAGQKTLSSTLTQIRVTTVSGTSLFIGGYINVMYE